MGRCPRTSGGEGRPGRLCRPRRDRDQSQLLDPQVARWLVAQARVQGLNVGGRCGLLQQMMKSALEAALAEELTGHLELVSQ